MDYERFLKDCESNLGLLTKMTFQSLEEINNYLSKQWKLLLDCQSECALHLIRNTCILNMGIKADSIPDDNACIFLRIFRLAQKKTVYRFDYDKVKEALHRFLQEAQKIEDDMASKENTIKTLEEELSSYQTGNEMIPISRFHRLAGSYQRILMLAIDLPDKAWANAIRKDARAALYGQGMEVIDYDGTNNQLFDVREDEDCKEISMVYPAIVRRKDNKIIATGMVYKPYELG